MAHDIGQTPTVSHFAAQEREDTAIAGVLFVALSAGFLTVIMLAAAMVPDYDFANGAISDLGVATETALLFNAGLIVAGGLNILGGYYFYRLHGRQWLLGLYTLAGIGAIGAGVFPLDAGAAHSLFALLAFLGFNLQAVGSGTQLRGALKTMALLAGGLGLVFVGVMILGDAGTTSLFGPFGHGGTERLIVYPAMLWLLALGGSLLTPLAPDARP